MTDEDVLPIVQCGDPVLRRPAEPVDPADLRTAELQRLIAQMRATMEAAPGVGLAAPQVGVPLQLTLEAGRGWRVLATCCASAGHSNKDRRHELLRSRSVDPCADRR